MTAKPEVHHPFSVTGSKHGWKHSAAIALVLGVVLLAVTLMERKEQQVVLELRFDSATTAEQIASWANKNQLTIVRTPADKSYLVRVPGRLKNDPEALATLLAQVAGQHVRPPLEDQQE